MTVAEIGMGVLAGIAAGYVASALVRWLVKR